MSIAIPLEDSAPIETYSGLQAFLVAHLELDTETQGQIETLIALAEYKLNRLLTTPMRETSETVVTTAAQQFVSLPTYMQQLRTAYLLGDQGYPLSPVTLNVLHGQFSDNSGKPQVYCISEQEMWFGPTPDAAYSVRLTYQSRLPPLTDENPTNWLLSQHADAYVYACIVQIESFRANDDRALLYSGALEQAIGEINDQGNRYRNAAPMRLRSPVVV